MRGGNSPRVAALARRFEIAIGLRSDFARKRGAASLNIFATIWPTAEYSGQQQHTAMRN